MMLIILLFNADQTIITTTPIKKILIDQEGFGEKEEYNIICCMQAADCENGIIIIYLWEKAF